MSADILSQSMLDADIENIYTCKTCYKSFNSNDLLLQHEFVHIDHRATSLSNNIIQVLEFSCDLCDARFSSGICFKEHMDWHKNSPVIIMDVLPNEEPEEPNAIELKPRSQILNNICKKCCTYFGSLSQVNSHDCNGKKIICKLCPKVFGSFHNMNRHMLEHQNRKITILQKKYQINSEMKDTSIENKKGERFKCPSVKCLSTFPDTAKLSLHMKWAHPEVERECPHCDETLQSTLEVQCHSSQENFGSGAEGFGCEVSGCNNIFTVRCMLIKHNKVVHGKYDRKIVSNEFVNHSKYGMTAIILNKFNNLVQDMIKESGDQPLPKELSLKRPKQFAFKSTKPPRNPQVNTKGLSMDEQESIKQSTLSSNPDLNPKELSQISHENENHSLLSANIVEKEYINEEGRGTDKYGFQCVICSQMYLQKEELIKHFQRHEGQIPSGLKKAYRKIKIMPQLYLEQELKPVIANEDQNGMEIDSYEIPIPTSLQIDHQPKPYEEKIVINMDTIKSSPQTEKQTTTEEEQIVMEMHSTMSTIQIEVQKGIKDTSEPNNDILHKIACIQCEDTFTSETKLTAHIDLHHKKPIKKIMRQIAFKSTRHPLNPQPKIMDDPCRANEDLKYLTLPPTMLEIPKKVLPKPVIKDIETIKESSKTNTDHVTHQTICNYCGDGFSSDPLHRAHIKSQHPKPIEKSTRQIAFKSTRPPSNPQAKLTEEPSVALEQILPIAPIVLLQLNSDKVNMLTILKDVKYNLSIKNSHNHKCGLCKKSFSKRILLKKHQENHKDCLECEKSFKCFSTLEKHMTSHTGEQPYACQYCNKLFSLNSNCLKHERGHTSENKPRLSKEKRFKHDELVERIGDSWKCKLCDYQSHRKYKVKTHSAKPNVHLESTANKIEFQGITIDGICSSMVEKLDYIWKCRNCEYKAKKKNNAIQHVEQIHLNVCLHQCTLCGKEFKSRLKVVRHIYLSHIKEKTFSCKDCDKSFVLNSILIQHMKVHNKKSLDEEKTQRLSNDESLRLDKLVERIGDVWKCKLCDYYAKEKSSVKTHAGNKDRHLKMTAEKLEFQGIQLDGNCSNMVEKYNGVWNCNICENKSKKKYKVTNHVENIHLNECSHKCMFCDKTLKSRRKITQHVYKRHIK